MFGVVDRALVKFGRHKHRSNQMCDIYDLALSKCEAPTVEF
jgi:hypothetical protein